MGVKMSTMNASDCWNKVCLSCNCEGEWLRGATLWFEFMQPGGESTKLHNYFLNRLNGDEQTANDCLQETLARFFGSVERGTFDYRRKVMPYIWSIADNVVNDLLRKSYYGIPIQSLEEMEEGKGDLVDQHDPTDADDAELAEALDNLANRAHLSEFQRQVLLLCRVHHLKPREAASFLQEPARRVSNELFRARKKIKEVTLKKVVGKVSQLAHRE